MNGQKDPCLKGRIIKTDSIDDLLTTNRKVLRNHIGKFSYRVCRYVLAGGSALVLCNGVSD